MNNRDNLGLLGSCLLLVLLPTAALTLSSCSSTPKDGTTTTAVYSDNVPGGVFVSTFQTNATIAAVDSANRNVTIQFSDGKKTVYKAGPQVVNFPQVRVGDQVRATASEELVVYMGSDADPTAAMAKLLASAPLGAKPGVLLAETVQVKTRVIALDRQHYKVTLQFPDGSTKIFPVRYDINMYQRNIGEEVVIRRTEALTIMVEKP